MQEPVHIVLHANTAQRLRVLAEAEGRSMTAIAGDALRTYANVRGLSQREDVERYNRKFGRKAVRS